MELRQTVQVARASDPREDVRQWAPTILWGENLLRLSCEDRDVLNAEGVDAFDGTAVGIDVPEIAGHGGVATSYRVPGSGQQLVSNVNHQPLRLGPC